VSEQALANLGLVGTGMAVLLLSGYYSGVYLMDRQSALARELGKFLYIGAYLLIICFAYSWGVLLVAMTIGWSISRLFGV